MHEIQEIQTHLKKSFFHYISGLLYGLLYDYFIEFSGSSLACELTSYEIFGPVRSEPISTSQKRAKIGQRAETSLWKTGSVRAGPSQLVARPKPTYKAIF